MQDQTGAEHRPCLLSTHYSSSSGGHGQGSNSTEVTSIAYPGASVPGPPFHTPFHPRIYEETSSFPSHQQGSAYAIFPPALSCHYTSQVPATDQGFCGTGGNQDAGAYPASELAEQWDAQVSWRYTFRLTISPKLFLIPIFTIQEDQRPMYYPPTYIQPPCASVGPSLLKNDVAVTSASPETSIVRGNGNSICDTVWNQDMGMYPTHHAQWDAQVAWLSTFHRPELFIILHILQAALGPMLDTTGDEQPTSVSPSPIEDKAASIAFRVSTPKGRRPTHNTDKHCPICSASLGRFQDRKRHILSHLPHWLQCQAPGCSWRGDRWEHLRKHRLNAHPSSGQELDTRNSVIYDPRPLVEGITDDTTFENAKMIATSLVEKRAKELEKSELWGDLWGRKRTRFRKVYRQSLR
jgi:hypothetical protein